MLKPYIPLLLALQLLFMQGSAIADVQEALPELEQIIENKQQRRERLQNKLSTLEAENQSVRREITSLNIDLKKLHQQSRKIEVMSSSPPSAEDKNKISKIAYKRRVAEIALDKNNHRFTILQAEEKHISHSITRLNSVLDSLNLELQAQHQQHGIDKVTKAHQTKEDKSKRLAAKRLRKQKDKVRRQQVAARKKKAAHKKQQASEKQRLVEEAQLEQKLAGLSQADAALMRAQYIAKNNPTKTPALGNSPSIKVVNPIGSKPKSVGKMEHLGNHQYAATITVKKGRQQYIIGDFTFTKSIPKHFNGLRCLVLVDARNNQVNFQLIAKK
ncbi:MAG: hypothetical protein HRU20_05790 [Pseudomonadales bacterium]|nr:hypothetical protein [Pseudomonadales bacterium]